MPIEGYRTVSVKEDALERLNSYSQKNNTSAPALIAAFAGRLDSKITVAEYLRALEAAATIKIHAAIDESILRAELTEISGVSLKIIRYLDQVGPLTAFRLEPPLNQINDAIHKITRVVVETHLEGLFFDDYKNLVKLDRDERKELGRLFGDKDKSTVVSWRLINSIVAASEELSKDVEHFSRLFPEDEKIQTLIREIQPTMTELEQGTSDLKVKADSKRKGALDPPKGVLPAD